MKTSLLKICFSKMKPGQHRAWRWQVGGPSALLTWAVCTASVPLFCSVSRRKLPSSKDGSLLPSGSLNYKYLWRQISPQGTKREKFVIKNKKVLHISSVNRVPIILTRLWAPQCSLFTISYKSFNSAEFFPNMLPFPFALSWGWKPLRSLPASIKWKKERKKQATKHSRSCLSCSSDLGLEKEEIIFK